MVSQPQAVDVMEMVYKNRLKVNHPRLLFKFANLFNYIYIYTYINFDLLHVLHIYLILKLCN